MEGAVDQAVDVTDATVVAQVLAGDVDAFRFLVARYRDRMWRYARYMLGSREEADEAVQDAFVRAYRALEHCQDPARIEPWLFRILTNRCRTRASRRLRYERTFVPPAGDTEWAVREVAHPEDRLAWREEIGRALLTLDERSREAFLLKYLDDQSYEEIAARTGDGISALKMRVRRACARLKEILEEPDHD